MRRAFNFIAAVALVLSMVSQAAPPEPRTPPDGFDQRQAGVPAGRLEPFEYDATASRGRYLAQVYLPPGYTKEQKYPVLYLLHGASGDERTWIDDCRADVIMDNLIDAKSAVPMIVVMPAAVAANHPAAASKDRRERMEASRAFERVLLVDLIPAVDARYATAKDPNSRAIAGLSAGAGQAFLIGLAHPEVFSSVAAFSLGGVGQRAVQLIKRPAEANKQFRTIWISCGEDDALLESSYDVVKALASKGIRHVWRATQGGHEPSIWKDGLYNFATRLSKP